MMDDPDLKSQVSYSKSQFQLDHLFRLSLILDRQLASNAKLVRSAPYTAMIDLTILWHISISGTVTLSIIQPKIADTY